MDTPTEADRLRQRLETHAAEHESARRAIAAVRALHHDVCGWCAECFNAYPCKTIRALGDEQ